jgi:hypothetical protein
VGKIISHSSDEGSIPEFSLKEIKGLDGLTIQKIIIITQKWYSLIIQFAMGFKYNKNKKKN